MSTKKAIRERARQEADAKAKANQPGSVIVTFKSPCHAVPWWRGARDEDFKSVFLQSGVNTNGDVIQVMTHTPSGVVNRLFNWRDVDSVVAVPSIPGPAPEPTKG